MNHITNPIIPGFNPDPCLCRKDDDYYIAVSSFEWFPGVPIYHSKDMKNWALITHCLKDEKVLNLQRISSSKGVWAPCLTWSESDKKFFLLFTITSSTDARYFDQDNFMISAPDIHGPWSEPVYLHSGGFDPSLFHDDDGRKWIVSLEWETREGYHKPGTICLVAYDFENQKIIGYPKRIWKGATKRGCIEGPHIYKRNGWYYLMCAEGGTGYGHCVTMARSRNIWGPYESDPENPILTSSYDFNEMDNDDFEKYHRFNPELKLQKAGHGSILETALGETYLAYHCGRPFLPELRCTLGREACLHKMAWTEDGWLRSENGNRFATVDVPGSDLPEFKSDISYGEYYFDNPSLPLFFYTPRIDNKHFTSLASHPGWLTIRGQESFSSHNKASLIARKLDSLNVTVTTCLRFEPEVYHHYAGLLLYYDTMNYVVLRKTWDERLDGSVLDLLRVCNGDRKALLHEPVQLFDEDVWLKLVIEDRSTQFYWALDNENYKSIGDVIDTSEFSDEYSEYGEFTGTFVGIGCVDSLLHAKEAAFKCFHYEVNKE